MGINAGQNLFGDKNIMIGKDVAKYSIVSNNNIFIGENVGSYAKTSNDNIYIGNNNAKYNKGHHNIIIGNDSDFHDLHNSIVIGDLIFGNNNTMNFNSDTIHFDKGDCKELNISNSISVQDKFSVDPRTGYIELVGPINITDSVYHSGDYYLNGELQVSSKLTCLNTIECDNLLINGSNIGSIINTNNVILSTMKYSEFQGETGINMFNGTMFILEYDIYDTLTKPDSVILIKKDDAYEQIHTHSFGTFVNIEYVYNNYDIYIVIQIGIQSPIKMQKNTQKNIFVYENSNMCIKYYWNSTHLELPNMFSFDIYSYYNKIKIYLRDISIYDKNDNLVKICRCD